MWAVVMWSKWLRANSPVNGVIQLVTHLQEEHDDTGLLTRVSQDKI